MDRFAALTGRAHRLFELVAAATARLAASYLAAGFVHGVLNSDNINITGESFDYGPWRFTPDWDPAFTAAYFDHYGLYAFGRQPEAIHWDLAQLGGEQPLGAGLASLDHEQRLGRLLDPLERGPRPLHIELAEAGRRLQAWPPAAHGQKTDNTHTANPCFR